MHRAWPLLFALTVALLAGGCGWHLRGASEVPPIGRFYLSASDRHSDLVASLNDYLRDSDIEVVADATAADYSLVILAEREDSRTATVNSNSRAAELALTEEADFTVLDRDGRRVLPRTTVVVERSFEYTEINALASDSESALLKREMQAELAQQIVRQLRRLAPLAAAKTPAS